MNFIWSKLGWKGDYSRASIVFCKPVDSAGYPELEQPIRACEKTLFTGLVYTNTGYTELEQPIMQSARKTLFTGLVYTYTGYPELEQSIRVRENVYSLVWYTQMQYNPIRACKKYFTSVIYSNRLLSDNQIKNQA